ncbi:hypothetical protein ACJJTC_018134 [Scirpophaga incertulas]
MLKHFFVIYRARLCLLTAALHTLAAAAAGAKYHRRSMPTQSLPVSKGGWRPVLGSSGHAYGGPYGAASLHAPTYKLPSSLLDYPSSARPLVARDSSKLTSIAQSYRPTTHRTIQVNPSNQPINSYHNPFYNNLSYKYIQNFPVGDIMIRNPQSPYSARPVYSKYPSKGKPIHQNSVLQQLSNIQPIQFGQYQTSKPVDIFGKPVETYARPADGKHQNEVYKLDSDAAPQSVSQVKTAQQQQHQHQKPHQQFHQLHPQQYLIATPKTPLAYPQYGYQDAVFPPSILGSFGSFGVQSVKGRDPVYGHTKTTYIPPQTSKQTIFNSFSYTPTFKTIPAIFGPTTTPVFQPTPNHIQYQTTFTDYNNLVTPTQPSKVPPAVKVDPNANTKTTGFKASPQDPFITKHYTSDNKLAVTTYNPVQATTLANFFDYNYTPSQQNQILNYYNQPTHNNYHKKQKIHDSVPAGDNQDSHQYIHPPKRPTYEVTEAIESDDVHTHSTSDWTHQSFESNPKPTEETVTKQLSPDTGFGRQTTTPVVELPDEYAIVTESEKGYENSLGYDSQVESQSRRPLGDDFEPIGKHKLKDYYYKVSTPNYEDYSSSKRTKKPIEVSKLPESTNKITANDGTTEVVTIPPNQHFKRPTTPEPLDKDKIRKRNKNRRRRPGLSNTNQNKESTTRKYSATDLPQTTGADEHHTVRPRIRPTKSRPQPNLTTPGITTELTTSVVPTISPTAPTIIKKIVRRPLTTLNDRPETTTQSFNDNDKDSSIMKIVNRLQNPKSSSNYEIPDYTHKQDEKDTPTSDIAVSLSDSKTTPEASQPFAFHKDVKPIEAKLEIRETTLDPTKSGNEIDATTPTADGTVKLQRPRIRNKFNRPKFSVKDYRNRLSSTTSTTEKTTESTPRLRFPLRKATTYEDEAETTTERKKFVPKDPRHKHVNGSELNEETEKEIHSIRYRQRPTTVENSESTTQRTSSRIRNGLRKPKPTEETSETTTLHTKRPLRKKIKDSEIGESVQDASVTDTTVPNDQKNDITSERTRSESAIMKIADKKHHQDPIEHLFEHSKRVSDLTLAASKDYNKPGMFKTVSSSSRRVPNYFTIATDDPILPIEAFFPQLNQKKES